MDRSAIARKAWRTRRKNEKRSKLRGELDAKLEKNKKELARMLASFDRPLSVKRVPMTGGKP